ncbi:hypothetical protein Tco_0401353 [Tanacetum coccineum]
MRLADGFVSSDESSLTSSQRENHFEAGAIGLGHSLETIDIEYEWKPPRCDTCKISDHTNEHCPTKPKTTTPTPVRDNGFMEVTRKGKRKPASKPRRIDGVRLTKPKPNYFYCPVDKSANVHREASTSQPKETVQTNTQPAANKVRSKSDDINIISFKNSLDALYVQDDVFKKVIIVRVPLMIVIVVGVYDQINH